MQDGTVFVKQKLFSMMYTQLSCSSLLFFHSSLIFAMEEQMSRKKQITGCS